MIPIPVAVVGGGRVARAVHVPLLLLRPDAFRLVAVVETDPRNAASLSRDYPGLTVTPSAEDAYAAGARGLVCATPWPTHRDVVTEALAHGMDILTEKPVSLDPADLTVLAEAERASAGTVAVGYMKRHDPAAARFVEAVSERIDRLRRVRVDIVDPDSPGQVAHRTATPVEPSTATRAAAERTVRALLPDATDGQRAVYSRGLGGSLIHQINLIHTALSASPYRLLGRVRHSTHWAEGSAVSCGWWPSDDLAVQMTHVRAPLAPAYAEVIEAVADDCRLTLRAPSPYLLEQSMTFTEESADGVRTSPSRPSCNGFVRQLDAWARSLRTGSPALPGLDEAQLDLEVVREAALLADGVAAAAQAPSPAQAIGVTA
ncbi:Gfo/Idh/MocA family protein [Streptomyces puniciscabiei]